MQFIDYGPGFINANFITRIRIEDEFNGYGAPPTYVVMIETLDKKAYRAFEIDGDKETAKKKMLKLVKKLGGNIIQF